MSDRTRSPIVSGFEGYCWALKSIDKIRIKIIAQRWGFGCSGEIEPRALSMLFDRNPVYDSISRYELPRRVNHRRVPDPRTLIKAAIWLRPVHWIPRYKYLRWTIVLISKRGYDFCRFIERDILSPRHLAREIPVETRAGRISPVAAAEILSSWRGIRAFESESRTRSLARTRLRRAIYRSGVLDKVDRENYNK